MKLDVNTEAGLLTLARSLDSQGLAQIYDQYSPELYRYAMRLLGDPASAEECVAETFHRFLHALRDGKGPCNFLRAYLYRVAHNWITDRYRREPLTEDLNERLAGQSESPEEGAMRVLRKRDLLAAIRRLTPDQRQVIALKFWDGWENEEIARAMGRPVGAIKSLQHRALAALQRHLEEEEK